MGWVEEEEMIWCCLINVSNDWFLVFILSHAKKACLMWHMSVLLLISFCKLFRDVRGGDYLKGVAAHRL